MAGGGFILDDAPSSSGDTKNKDEKFTGTVFALVTLSAIGGFLFGYDTGIVSGAMVFIREDYYLTSFWQEAIISITILGAWIFSLIAAPIATKFGRKKVVTTASIIFTVGSIEMAFAQDKWSLLFGRFIVGAAIGLASMIVPMFIAEVAPARIRGSLVTTNQLFIAGGQAVAAVTAGGFSYIQGSLKWRLMLGVAAIPAVIQMIGFLFVPESPRWLLQKGRDLEARQVLIRLRGKDADIETEFHGIKNQVDSNRNQSTSYRDVLGKVIRDPSLRRALMIGCLLQATGQLSGINTVMYYAATIIQMSGVHDAQQAVWMASATALLNFLVCFLGIWLVEKIGRRKLTLSSLAGVAFSLGLLAVGFHVLAGTSPNLTNEMDVNFSNDSCATQKFSFCSQCIQERECGFCYSSTNESMNSCVSVLGGVKGEKLKSEVGTECSEGTNERVIWAENWCPSPYSWLTLLGLSSYLLFFGPGLGPMPWTINSELYPLWARSVCYSVTTAVNWACNLLISLTFLTLTEWITSPGTFWLYTAFSTTGWILLFMFLPETKGRSLESDIGQLIPPSDHDQRKKRRQQE